MIFAPFSRASITHWKPTGWFSAIDDPMIRMASALLRSCWAVVAPPRPKDVPRPGTGRAVSNPCLIAQAHHPKARSEEFLDQVIFFDIQRCSTQMRNRFRLHQGLAVAGLFEILGPRVPNAFCDHIHRGFQG